MDTSLTQAITNLAKGEILRVDDALGQSIAVVRGMVWVTQEGDRRDTFLSDGESFIFDQRGTALAQAITDTRLIAFVGEAAEVIEAEPAPAAADAGGHRGLAARIRLHQDLARAHAARASSLAPTGLTERSTTDGVSLMRTIFNSLREWVRRSNERFELTQLSDRQLRDIGLDRARVLSEATKPFWRG